MFQWLYKNKKSSVVFLDKNGIIGEIPSNQKVDIILTPSFYWFIKKELSVKFNFQVKEYLPSIFEEFISKKNLSYLSIPKEDGVFWLFGYDDRDILDSLEKNGVESSKIGKIYFAQNISSTEKTINLSNGYLLTFIDDTLSRVPESFAKKSESFKDILSDNLSLKDGIALKRYRSFIDEKLLKKVMIPLLVLIILEGFEVISVWQKNQNLSLKKENLFKSYALPATSFQNRAILSNLKKRNLKQQRIRELSYLLSQAPFKSGEYIENLQINTLKASATIRLKDIKNAEKYKSYFINHIGFATIDKILVKDSNLVVEFSL